MYVNCNVLKVCSKNITSLFVYRTYMTVTIDYENVLKQFLKFFGSGTDPISLLVFVVVLVLVGALQRNTSLRRFQSGRDEIRRMIVLHVG